MLFNIIKYIATNLMFFTGAYSNEVFPDKLPKDIEDEYIKLKEEGKINNQNYKEYLDGNFNVYEYDSINSCLILKNDASFYWYRNIAFNDDPESKYQLFTCYLNGENGVTQNINEALFWLEQAANGDILEAQVVLAKLYEEEGDLKNAQYWYQRGYESKRQ